MVTNDSLAPASAQCQTSRGDTAHEVVVSVCVILVAMLFGLRFGAWRTRGYGHINTTRWLVFVSYFTALAYLSCNHLLLSRISHDGRHACAVVTIICLALYLPNKCILYFILIERAHATRASRYSRLRDWVWISGIGLVTCEMGAMGGVAYKRLYSSYDANVCHFVATNMLLDFAIAADIIVNVALTMVFVVVLYPALRFRTRIARMPSVASEEFITDAHKPTTINMPKLHREKAIDRLDHYFREVATGSALAILPTVTNVAILRGLGGRVEMWLCLVLCAIDVTLQVCIVHWLTHDRHELEDDVDVGA